MRPRTEVRPGWCDRDGRGPDGNWVEPIGPVTRAVDSARDTSHMSIARSKLYFGRASRRMRRGLAKQPPEPILDPDLPLSIPITICGIGRTIATCSTTFLPTSAPVITSSPQCSKNATACTALHGPEELRSVGETEFVAGIAAMSASGSMGQRVSPPALVLRRSHPRRPCRAGAGSADPGRWRTVPRRAPFGGLGRQRIDWQSRTATGPHVLRQADFRAGLAPADRARPVPDAWLYHSPA